MSTFRFSKIVSKGIEIIKEYQEEIVLVIGVILVALLCFAAGYITAKLEEKREIRFNKFSYYETGKNRYCGGRNMWSLPGK